MSDIRTKFMEVYSILKSELLNDPAFEFTDDSRQWVERMLDYNVPGGKLNLGLSGIDSYELLKGGELTNDENFLACALGWCIEWLKAYFLVLDDIMDNSITRHGQPCWFRLPKIGMVAVNDGILLRNHIPSILKKHFREKPYYVDLLDLFNESPSDCSIQNRLLFILPPNLWEKPVWPMRLWIVGYDIGCVLNLLLLYGRYRNLYATQGDGLGLSDVEQQRDMEESSNHLMNKRRTSLELFFAIWFVIGNVWVFELRVSSFHRASKLHVLCISLLAWSAICYSFPFLLFLLLCCCVPLISSFLGYNMNMGSIDRGASEDQISQLPSWKYKAVDTKLEHGNDADCNSGPVREGPECCICLAKYREKEEVKQLPCSHMFHLKCVDQWLKIISCCHLCKQELER